MPGKNFDLRTSPQETAVIADAAVGNLAQRLAHRLLDSPRNRHRTTRHRPWPCSTCWTSSNRPPNGSSGKQPWLPPARERATRSSAPPAA